jgi:glucuronate isomerase
MIERSPLSPDRFFAAEPGQRKIARQLYASVLNLPLVCPCVNINPELFSDPANSVGDPCELLLLSDVNILRRLKMQGLNVEKSTQKARESRSRESENRKIWQFLVDHSLTIRGIPADIWLSEILFSVFGIKERLATKNAQRIYDAVCDSLQRPEYSILKLIERFNIEILGIVDSPVDPSLSFSRPDWAGRLIPCFNGEPLYQVHLPEWSKIIQQLSDSSQVAVADFSSFIRAIQKQRMLFKTFGATTIIHPIAPGNVSACPKSELEDILRRSFAHEANQDDARLLMNHMLFEMIVMSMEDRLVLQVHHSDLGSSTSSWHFTGVGDQPEILKATGRRSQKSFIGEKDHVTMIHFPAGLQSLNEIEKLVDEFPFSRIGVPSWFFNGLSSIKHYFDHYVDNFGWYRIAGLNNFTGSILTLPSQHDIWRRTSANWLAGLVVNGLVDLENAYEIIYALAYNQAKSTYKI